MAELIQRSQRFTRAALAERNRLARQEARLQEQRETLEEKLGGLSSEITAIREEIARLDELAGTGTGLMKIRKGVDGDRFVLKGAAIRLYAVPLLIRERTEAPIHYRDWLALLNQEGYEVAGQRPDAVFLNQVVRSPLVRATTTAGYYAIDLAVVDRLRGKLHQQQAELAAHMRAAPAEVGAAFDQHRERQREMNMAIARTERELDEAEKAVEAGQASGEPGEARVAA